MVLKSPGIAYREVDATVYPVTIDSSIVGIVGLADKGPENKATLITTPEQLINTFGEPNENLPGQGLIAALEILEVTNRIYFVRATSGSDIEASAAIPIGTCPYVNVLGYNYLGVSSGASAVSFHVELKKNGTQIASSLYTIPAVSTLGENPFQNSYDALVSVVGDGTSKGDLIGVSKDPYTNEIIFHGTLAGPQYTLSVSSFVGTTLPFTAANAAAALYFLSSTDPVSGASSEAFSANIATGTTLPAGAITASTCSGFGTELSSNFQYLVKSLYAGPGYNLGTSLKTGEVTGLSLTVDNTVGPWFNFFVNDKGYVNESFRLSFYGDNTFITNVIKESEGDTPLNSAYIKGSVLSGVEDTYSLTALKSFADRASSLVGVEASNITIKNCALATFKDTEMTVRCIKPIPNTYKLLGGKHAIDYEGTVTSDTLDALFIGDPDTKAGMYALDDDNLNISMALVPGIYNAAVQNELITIAETSQNFIAAVSPPVALKTAQKAIDWMNGRGVDDRKTSINSSFVAVYWPWVQVFNTYTETDVWLDPAIYGVRAMAFTDSVSEPWFAPAGFNRGRLTKPLDTELVLSQGDRDALYENNINPMVKFFPEGITIFGQKTAKRLPSATDRINVRRLMIFLRKTLLQTTRGYVFEPNDALTWESVRSSVNDILRDIASRRGIAESKVVCDETVNTPLRVSRRELWCKIILRPVEAAEYIIFEVNLTNNTSSVGA